MSDLHVCMRGGVRIVPKSRLLIITELLQFVVVFCSACSFVLHRLSRFTLVTKYKRSRLYKVHDMVECWYFYVAVDGTNTVFAHTPNNTVRHHIAFVDFYINFVILFSPFFFLPTLFTEV